MPAWAEAVLPVLLAVAGALLARMLLWRLLFCAASIGQRVPSLASSPAWRRAKPVQAWLRRTSPGAYGFLSARLATTSFVGLPLTLVVLAALYLAALLGGLTEAVIETGAVLRFDQAINDFIASWRSAPLVAAFLWITALGAGPALTAVAVTASLFLWADRRVALVLPLWVAFLGGQVTTWAGKFAIARHRPDFIEAASAASPAFPSGHATGSLAVFGFLAYALARELADRRQQFELAYWMGVLIALIGFSRLVLSVHYTTDVLAGFLVGGFWLLVGCMVAEWTRGRRNA